MLSTTPEYNEMLVRGLAHRMNNILTLFHGYLGMVMANQRLDTATAAHLSKIQNGACAASDLIDRTHSLVRPSLEVFREIEVAPFLENLRPLFKSWQRPSGTLQLEAAGDLPKLRIDALRLKEALGELVRNAIEAAPAKGVVSVSARAVDGCASAAPHAGAWVEFSVTDNGPGIPEELEEKIFRPFFSTKRDHTKCGLGLNIAQGFAQQAGGALRFTRNGRRTEFILRVPAVRSTEA